MKCKATQIQLWVSGRDSRIGQWTIDNLTCEILPLVAGKCLGRKNGCRLTKPTLSHIPFVFGQAKFQRNASENVRT